MAQKKDLSQLAKAPGKKPSLLSTAIEKKTLESSRPVNSRQKKKDPWKDYDYDNMPELSVEQLATFRLVTPQEHKAFAKAKVGRPKKSLDNKENVIGIRFSNKMIVQLKEMATQAQMGWQTYVKTILEEHVTKMLKR